MAVLDYNCKVIVKVKLTTRTDVLGVQQTLDSSVIQKRVKV